MIFCSVSALRNQIDYSPFFKSPSNFKYIDTIANFKEVNIKLLSPQEIIITGWLPI